MSDLHPSQDSSDSQDSYPSQDSESADSSQNWIGAAIIVIVGAILFHSFISEYFGENKFTYLMMGLSICSAIHWFPVLRKASIPLISRLNFHYPSLFLIIGVLGTFVGIFEALQGLNKDSDPDITPQELNTLIKGLTLSFQTSIAGIIYSLSYRGLVTVFGKEEKDPDAGDIIIAINDMSKKLDTFIDDLHNEVVNGLTKAIQGLTTNLQEIISDKLGEAFRELNESIIHLNNWVKEYKEQVNTLTNAYKDFANKAERITSSLEPLPQYMEGIEDTLTKVNQPMQEFSALGQQAREALENLQKLTQNFEQSTNEFQKVQQQAATLAKELHENAENLNGIISETTKKQLEAFASELASISNKFAEDYTPITTALSALLTNLDTRKKDE